MSDTAPSVFDLIATGYSMQFKEKGSTHEGVMWAEPEDQTLRFQAQLDLIKDKLPENGMSVNDLGCGYGAFFEYIRDLPAMQNGRFYGYDICADFISAAMLRYPDPRALFLNHHAASLEADFSFASGTFNMKGPVSEDEWNLYVKQALKELFEKSNRAMVFNLLTRDHPDQHEWLYYCDPDDFLTFCQKGISPYTTLQMNPDLHGFTICVSKD